MPGTSEQELYFDDPRLRMTLMGRLFVRIASYVFYLFLIVLSVTLLLADLKVLFSVGLLTALFLVDRLLHHGQGDRPLWEIPESGRINLDSYLTAKAFSALERAFDRSGIKKIDPMVELLREVMNEKIGKEMLARLEIDPLEFSAKLTDFAKEAKGENTKEERRAICEVVVREACLRALKRGHSFIGIPDLIAALAASSQPQVMRLWAVFSVSAVDAEHALLMGELREPEIRMKKLRHRVVNRAWTSRPTPTLDKVSQDFTDLARSGDGSLLVGHGEEYKRLTEVLARTENPNALLVGEAGSGKETMVKHLAYEITRDNVPPALFDKRLVAIYLGQLVAGAAPEELHKRLQTIVAEIMKAGNIIIFIPDMHELVHTSGTAYLSAADALMPVISHHAFPIIGSTYPREYKENIESRSDLRSIFEVIRVEEINEEEAANVLIPMNFVFERKHGLKSSMSAIKAAVGVSKKHIKDAPLPGSAINLLEEAFGRAAAENRKAVGEAEVLKVAEEKTNIPLHEAKGEEAERLLNFEALVHEKFIDQEPAVTAVATALREYRSGLGRKGGPIASFLFVGPTGVGKTELAKNVARLQFGSEDAMARIDMSEYAEGDGLARMLGSADGKTGGVFLDAVRRRPYSVILLDEFEKSHREIRNLFLQIFDEGRVTDAAGRQVDFKNTVIIATSNAHTEIVSEALSQGESVEAISEYLKRKLVDVFPPELLNRFSKIVVFRELKMEEIVTIAELQLKSLAEQLKEQNIDFVFEPEAVAELAKLGYEPMYGARPLRNAVEEKIRSPLAEKILRKEFTAGDKIKLVFAETFKFIKQ